MSSERFSLRPRPWRRIQDVAAGAWGWLETILGALIAVVAILTDRPAR